MNRVNKKQIVTSTLACWAALAAAAAAPTAPGADFGPDACVADLGRMAVGENRTRDFAFTNATPAALRVRAVEPSCDCLTVLDYPGELAAGAVGSVVVNVFAEKPGDFAFAVALEFEGGAQRYFVTQVTVAPAAPAAAAPDVAPGRVSKALRLGAARPIDPEVLQRVARTRDRSLYRALDADLVKSIQAGAWRVVDLRGEAAYAAHAIPGALNIPAAAVPTKNFLHRGPVLLVDEGWGGAATERACRGLRAAGNEESAVLLGGMAAWVQHGGALSGAAPSPAALQRLTPREFLGVRGYDDWVVAQASTNAAAVARLLHEAVPLADVRPKPWQRVLLLEGDVAPPPAAGAVCFSLQGGIAALEREFRDMTAMRHSQTLSTARKVTGRRWEVLRSGCGCK